MKKGSASTLAILLALSLFASACSSAVATPTQAPAATKGAESAKPAAAPTRTAEPSGSSPTISEPAATKPAATSAAKTDWQAEWDKTLAAAKQEGKVVVAGAAGPGYRKAVDEFQKAYPDIKLEFTGGSTGVVHAPKILAERQSGVYLWDVLQGAGTVMLDPFIPQKAFAPLRPALILPEVLDDSKWLDGLESGWIDLAHQYAYSPLPYVSYIVQVNREVAPAAELSAIDQLMEPKWKGKIAWADPRIAGSGRSNARYFYYMKGADWLRKLLSQDIVLTRDSRAMLESLIRGVYPIAIGTNEDEVEAFTKEGLTGHLEYLETDSMLGGNLTGGMSSIAMFDKAPHPNAARVFINWYMTKAAAEAYVREAGLASMRLDVGSPPKLKPRPGDINTHSEAFTVKVIPAADDLIKEVLK